MDDRGQVAFEYLVIISMLVLLSAIVVLLSAGIFGVSGDLKSAVKNYSGKTSGLLRY